VPGSASASKPLVTASSRAIRPVTKVSTGNAAEAILAGDLEASVAQRPYNMGQMGVEYVLKLAAGEELPEEIDTGAILVTPENAAEFQ